MPPLPWPAVVPPIVLDVTVVPGASVISTPPTAFDWIVSPESTSPESVEPAVPGS